MSVFKSVSRVTCHDNHSHFPGCDIAVVLIDTLCLLFRADDTDSN